MEAISLDSFPAALVIVHDGLIVQCNALLGLWVGRDVSELIGHPFDRLVSPPATDPEGEESLPGVMELSCADGSSRPVLVTESLGPEGHRYVTMIDATEQRAFRKRIQARQRLVQRTQNRLQLVIEASIAFSEAEDEGELARVLVDTAANAYAAEEAVVYFLDEETVTFRQIAGVNPLTELADADRLALQGRDLRTVVKISGVEAAYGLSAAIGDAFVASGVQSMIVAPIHEGMQQIGLLGVFFHHPRQFDEQASPLADALAGQAARAITALRLKARLAHAATHDETTGLPNRRLLEERIDAAPWAASTAIGVVFVDLDGFKSVNDLLGHPTGDAVLREVARRLQSAVRDRDIVARYGGDEFVVICEVANEVAALEIAERLRETIRAPYSFLPDGMTLGASIGVSVTRDPPGAIPADQLVRTADQAMYRAKFSGGDRVVTAAL